jgi:hypothetical protein
MAYSIAKLKSSGDRASPCFKGKLVGQIFAYTDSTVSFKHILISPTSFLGIPNSMRMLYNASLLTES